LQSTGGRFAAAKGRGEAMGRLGGRDTPEEPRDDWLAEDDDLEWLDAPEAEEPSRAGRYYEPVGAPAERAAPGADAAVIARRRRILALAALGLVVAAIIGVVIATSGGSNKSTTVEPVPPPAVTPPPTPPAKQPPASQPAPVPPPTPAATLKVTLPANGELKVGDTGAEVLALQKVLEALSYDVGKPDGSFGPATQEAVIAFQKAQGLTPDGVVGGETAKELTAALSGPGARG
jgi:hypothetical protein